MIPVLLVPASGLLQVTYHDLAFDLPDILAGENLVGQVVALATKLDDREFRVVWYANTGPPNERARAVFAFLTGAHLLFTGPVGFVDLPPETVTEIVADLSREQ
jgi:hypothetical protein